MAYLLASLAALADIGGGLLPLHRRVKNVSPRYIFAFASGVVVAAAFFELLPEAMVETNWGFVGLGFFTVYLLEKGLGLHACGESECAAQGVGWITVVGMASDNVIDGIGIGTGFGIDPILGVIITLAVVAHEVPQGMTTTLIMKQKGYKFSRILAVLFFAGAMDLLGTTVASLIPPAFQQRAIAFVAGVFIYVGAAALLNEAHKQFNVWVVVNMLVGASLALLLKFLE